MKQFKRRYQSLRWNHHPCGKRSCCCELIIVDTSHTVLLELCIIAKAISLNSDFGKRALGALEPIVSSNTFGFFVQCLQVGMRMMW